MRTKHQTESQNIDTTEEIKSLARKYNNDLMPNEVYTLMSEQCLSDNQLAEYFKVSEQTIKQWKIKHPDFKESYYKGKDDYRGDIIEDVLYKTAIGYTVEEVTTKETTIKGKLPNGVFCPVPAIETTIKKVHIQPNQKALHTILYNRLPQRYKDNKTPALQTNNYQQNNLQIDTSKLTPEQLKALLDISKQLKKDDENTIDAEIIG